MTLEEATRFYGYREPEPELTVEDMQQLLTEVLAGAEEPSIKTEEARKMFEGLKEDVAEIERRGLTVAYPKEF